LAQDKRCGGEALKGTNTKVSVEIVRRICRDIVAASGSMNLEVTPKNVRNNAVDA
jgi:hypothetical protein